MTWGPVHTPRRAFSYESWTLLVSNERGCVDEAALIDAEIRRNIHANGRLGMVHLGHSVEWFVSVMPTVRDVERDEEPLTGPQ